MQNRDFGETAMTNPVMGSTRVNYAEVLAGALQPKFVQPALTWLAAATFKEKQVSYKMADF